MSCFNVYVYVLMRIVFADGQGELKPRFWYLPALKSGASMWIDNVAILKNNNKTQTQKHKQLTQIHKHTNTILL